MTKSLHPLETTHLIRDSYLRYLKTIYPFQAQDLRDQFWQALQQSDLIVKGPLLEASPPFETGRSLAQLVAEGILHPTFRELDSSVFPWERPLYQHQDQAISKVVQGRRNLVVATGTGSGKTETFLIPILDHLLRERAAGTLGPGVRALLLYPMNALANDQLKRLRRILAHFPAITFGRYTGETKERDNEAETSFYEQFRGEELLPNELISRVQMREEPPHLLLTNYAMLEYLLLRPKDNTFFDGPLAQHWRFIALDEAHVYNGASGIEIAMLLRRLKERVVHSKAGRLRCLATSATMGQGKEDYPAVVTFARELFGEPFVWQAEDDIQQDVVEASRVDPAALGEVWGEGQPDLYPALQQALDTAEPFMALRQAAQTHQVPALIIAQADQQSQAKGNEADRLNQWLYALLRGDARLQHLQTVLIEAPQFLAALAEQLFPDQVEQAERLISLVNLAVRARPTPDALSLLPARYHVFARALEGAFACLNQPFHTETHQPRLFLTRHETCPHCDHQVFELATCTRCGITYLVGRIVKADNDRDRRYLRHLTHQPDDQRGERAYFVLGDQRVGLDEDEAVATEEEIEETEGDDPAIFTLCFACGAIEPGSKMMHDCGCPPAQRQVIYRADLKGKRELNRCLSCGSLSPSGIVFRFLTGQDAPVSVLATALYQTLPAANDSHMENLPGQGRKLLSFADSRQDAAFFAPYLERTYQQLLRRRLILKAVLEHEAGLQGQLRLQDVTGPLLKQAEAVGQFSQAQSYTERQTKMNTWLMQELIAWDRRISLEGLGLLRFRLVRPQGWGPPPPLLAAPWNLSPDEVWHLMELLLDTLRQQGAVTFMDQVDPRGDAFAPRNRTLYLRQEKADPKKGIFAWIPAGSRSNRRLDILAKLLARTSDLAEAEGKNVARQILNGLWKHLTDPNSLWREHLPAENLGGGRGFAHRLSHLFWEVVPVGETDTPAYRCSRCRNISYVDLYQVCPAYGCQGQLEPLDMTEPNWVQNHYRHLYQNLKPIPFSAREHTAQWTSTEATLVQQQFVRGELNALSCSTTFELGVDVGELQAVLMRNMPPTTANYVQRAGRAGRRTDSAALALTYAQRRSHDLTYFTHPERIVAGVIRPPVVIVANEKIVRRHAHSLLFSAFFRWAKEQHNRDFNNVGDFFAPPPGQDSGPDLLRQFVAPHPLEIKAALQRVVPPAMQPELDIEGWGWLPKLLDHGEEADGILDRASQEVLTDLEEFARMEQEILADGGKHKYRLAGYYQRVAETIRARYLFGFLGSRNVLPKYGFPTDVVELRTNHLPLPEANKVELQRDLKIAIAEYAPGGQVVAGGKVWTSGGIHRQANREWPPHYYAVCPECTRFHHSLERDIDGPCVSCGANLHTGRNLRGQFIIPEFGFIVAEEPKDSAEKRPDRLYATQVYFSDYDRPQEGEAEEHLETITENLSSSRVQIWHQYSRYGKLALVNAGPLDRGFQVCQWCGFAQPAPPPQRTRRRNQREEKHRHPRTGKDCKGFIQTYHLGHEFITDVLELRFRGSVINDPNPDLWRSVLFALLEGASHALGIRRDDLDGTLWRRRDSGPIPSIILFDTVPGGAGHVRRVADELQRAFEAAFERVNECECGEETSCYECLRNFRNQYYHDQLSRGHARDFLGQILAAAGVKT